MTKGKLVLICFVLQFLISLTFTASLHANNDNYRHASLLKVKKAWGVPVKVPGGLILNEVSYDKDSDTAFITYLGEPDRDDIMADGKAFWASESGKNIKSKGFRDWVYMYGYKDKEYGVFSCAEGKWYRDVRHYMTAHGIK